MPDRPVSYVGGVSLHTLPDMTPEPTAEEVAKWLLEHRPPPAPWGITAVLDAREALIAERETPPQFVPHVLLPADWAVYYTWTVTVTANDPEVPDEPVWCVKHRDGWCATEGNHEPAEGTWSVPTRCGFCVTLPGGYEKRQPDCPDCLAADPAPLVGEAVMNGDTITDADTGEHLAGPTGDHQ